MVPDARRGLRREKVTAGGLEEFQHALSSNDAELARSITTCAPAMACLSPSPVMVLMPLWGEAATTSWSPRRRMATVFEPIRPVPPMTTTFMVCPPWSMTGDLQMGSNARPDAGERRLAPRTCLSIGGDCRVARSSRSYSSW